MPQVPLMTLMVHRAQLVAVPVVAQLELGLPVVAEKQAR